MPVAEAGGIQPGACLHWLAGHHSGEQVHGGEVEERQNGSWAGEADLKRLRVRRNKLM